MIENTFNKFNDSKRDLATFNLKQRKGTSIHILIRLCKDMMLLRFASKKFLANL